MEEETKTPAQRVVELLQQHGEPLYAVLDGARDPQIAGIVAGSGEAWRSLFDGPGAGMLEEVGPLLVRLPAGSLLLDVLAHSGWGQSWGIFLASDADFGALWWHLRARLAARDEQGASMLLRYYDPRVLRSLLPACSPSQVTELFGPVSRYLVESEDGGEVFEFSQQEGVVKLRRDQIEVAQARRSEEYVDKLIASLRENQPATIAGVPDERLRARVRWGIERAMSYEFKSEHSVALFVSLLFLMGPGFDEYPLAQSLLRDPAVPPEERVGHAVARMSESQWQHAKARGKRRKWPDEELAAKA